MKDKEYIFKFEGKSYITDANTIMDAEIKFWDEFGYDPDSCVEVKGDEIDKLVYSEEEVLYF